MNRIIALIVPHKHNNWHPHSIRSHGLAIALFVILCSQALYNYQQTGSAQVLSYATNVSSGGLLSATNSERTGQGLSALKLNSKLSAAAQAKANHMIANNYWSHVAPDGTTPWYFINNAGYTYLKAGENLAYGFLTSSAAVAGWMASPGHRANILTAEYEEVGFGFANGASYQGDKNTVIVAMYADPVNSVNTAPVANTQPGSAPQIEQPAQSPQPVVVQPKPVEPKLVTTKNPEILIGQPSFQTFSEESIKITNAQALMSGQANWALYVTSMVLTFVVSIYLYRHVVFVQRLVVHGEYILHSHPLFDASMAYLILWIVLNSSYGVIQ